MKNLREAKRLLYEAQLRFHFLKRAKHLFDLYKRSGNVKELEECYGILTYELPRRLRSDQLSEKRFSELLLFLERHFKKTLPEIEHEDPHLAKKIRVLSDELKIMSSSLLKLFSLEVHQFGVLPKLTSGEQVSDELIASLKKTISLLLKELTHEIGDLHHLERLIHQLNHFDMLTHTSWERALVHMYVADEAIRQKKLKNLRCKH